MTLEPKLTGGLTSDSSCSTLAYRNQSKSGMNILFEKCSYVLVLEGCLPGSHKIQDLKSGSRRMNGQAFSDG